MISVVQVVEESPYASVSCGVEQCCQCSLQCISLNADKHQVHFQTTEMHRRKSSIPKCAL